MSILQKPPALHQFYEKKFRTLRSSTLQKKFNRTLWTPILQKKTRGPSILQKPSRNLWSIIFRHFVDANFTKKPRSPLVLRKPSQALWNPIFFLKKPKL